MIKRIYIDNFRCLANFELKLDGISLLLGANGSGKSSVLDALRKIQEFVIGGRSCRDVFQDSDLTRWLTLSVQRFEIDMEIEGKPYSYQLVIEHQPSSHAVVVQSEQLVTGGPETFLATNGRAKGLFHGGVWVEFPYIDHLSVVNWIVELYGSKPIEQFRNVLSTVYVIRPLPFLMNAESRRASRELSYGMENYVSWYRHIAYENMSSVVELLGVLKEVLPGFESINLKEAGEEVRVLKAQFQGSISNKPESYNLNELSDGQRMLLALYTVVYGLKGQGGLLFIDEPDNFVALSEIQPWLSHLVDACGDWLGQAVLISHHPEIINYLGDAHGRWFSRESQGPVRVADTPPEGYPGITLAETVARGWA